MVVGEGAAYRHVMSYHSELACGGRIVQQLSHVSVRNVCTRCCKVDLIVNQLRRDKFSGSVAVNESYCFGRVRHKSVGNEIKSILIQTADFNVFILFYKHASLLL